MHKETVSSFKSILILLVFISGVAQAQDAAIDVRKDIIEPLTHWEIGEFRDKVLFETKEMTEVRTASHTDLKFVFRSGDLILQLSYDAKAVGDPKLILPDAAFFALLRHSGDLLFKNITITENGLFEIFGPVANLYGMSELFNSAEAGDPAAMARVLRWKIAVLENMDVTDKFEKQFPGTQEYLSQLKKQESLLLADLVTRAKQAAEKALEDLKKSQRGSEQKLTELVLNNDRAGVANYLRTVLPWAIMKPAEVQSWKIWIEAIEHPDPKSTVLAFRGFSYKEHPLRKQTAAGESFGFLAPIMNRDLKHADQGLQTYAQTRTVMGDPERGHISDSKAETVVRMAEIMSSHAEGGLPSIFLSFTPRIDIAENFVSGDERFPGPPGSLLAVRMDKRRLLPNVANDMKQEVELLAPLLVFPDEVLLYQEKFDKSEKSHEQFVKTLELRGENLEKNLNQFYDGGHTRLGFEFFKKIQKGSSAVVRTCRQLF